jgi:hypothetical protein
VVELFLQPAHLLHQLIGVIGCHQLGHLVEPVEFDLDLAEALLDVAADGFLLVERWFLLQDPDGCAGRQEGVAVVGLIETGRKLRVTSSRMTLSPWALRTLRMV